MRVDGYIRMAEVEALMTSIAVTEPWVVVEFTDSHGNKGHGLKHVACGFIATVNPTHWHESVCHDK